VLLQESQTSKTKHTRKQNNNNTKINKTKTQTDRRAHEQHNPTEKNEQIGGEWPTPSRTTTEPPQTTHEYDHEVARPKTANNTTIARKQHELRPLFGQRLSKDHRQGPQH
jgi:hypothetical protein